MKSETLPLNKIQSVVVRVPNWVGDAVMAVPALRRLRGVLPQAHITLVSRPGAADIFLDADFMDEVLVYDRTGLRSAWNQIHEWRRRKFDLALLLQNAFEAAALAYLSRVPVRIGYETDRRGLLLTNPLPLPAWKNERHESFYYLNVIEELESLPGRSETTGARSETTEPRFDLYVSENRKRAALRLVHEARAGADAPIALLCPGSINSRAKRWPTERFAALADRLADAGANVVLIGSPGEADLSQRVCAQARRSPIVLTGRTSVAEVTAIISIADLLVTNDTGPAHIGAALGTPTLVIFGPTNPLTTFPFSASAEIIRRAPDCAPCMLRNCPIDHRCMTAITPDDVFQRASVLMSQRRAEVTA